MSIVEKSIPFSQAPQSLAFDASSETQMPIFAGAIKGDTISFTAGGESYGGKVDGDSVIFSQTPGGARMTATRVAADAK